MKSHLLILSFALLVPLDSMAANIAVVDSGVDFAHTELAGREMINAGEIAGNRVDDDRNGKVDDLVGWNFVDRYNRVFFREHLPDYSPVVYRLLEIIGRQQAGKSRPTDQVYWDKHVTNLSDEQKLVLINHLNSFGQYAHGTHVAGIVAQHAPHARILAARVFGDEPPPEYVAPADFLNPLIGKDGKKKDGASWTSIVYKLLAAVNAGVFDQVAVYLNEQKVDVANYSLGVPLQMIAKALLAARGIDAPTPEQLSAETKRAYANYEPHGKKWIGKAPNTLFVIAAGNDGTDNDALPTFPSNVRMPNSISVAATLDYTELADFSCFGATTVDIAAPGVAIDSSVPNADNRSILPMSGTSMAAPIVAGVAGHVKALNPKLTPVDIKTILMGTVDKKTWLKGKVISEGIVNSERAYDAAKRSVSIPLAEAVAMANRTIRDVHSGVVVRPAALEMTDDGGMSEFARRLVF